MGTLEALETKLELFFLATEKDIKENKADSNIFLSCIGRQGREVYNMIIFSKEEESFDFNVIVQDCENFCTLRQNLLGYKFLT